MVIRYFTSYPSLSKDWHDTLRCLMDTRYASMMSEVALRALRNRGYTIV